MWSWIKNLFRKKPDLKLIKVSDESPYPKWYLIASKELGQKEIYSGDNPRILEYHSATVLSAKRDEIPWCSSFVSWCLEEAGVRSTKSAWARDYLKWGAKLDIPRIGCIVVLKRGENSGHVGFYVAEDHEMVVLLGGNQNNAVSIARYPKKNVLGYRWPIS